MYNILEVKKGKWTRIEGRATYIAAIRRLEEIVYRRVNYEDDKVLSNTESRYVMRDCVLTVLESKKRN